jgi:hypothetical protein
LLVGRPQNDPARDDPAGGKEEEEDHSIVKATQRFR